jgi:hypothetical protein
MAASAVIEKLSALKVAISAPHEKAVRRGLLLRGA